MGLFDLFTGTKRPPAGTPVLPAAQLLERLRALNRATAPWQVADGKSENVDLIAQWKVDDPAFREHFQKADSSKVFRVFLKLDEAAHEVRASDREAVLSRIGARVAAALENGQARRARQRLAGGDDAVRGVHRRAAGHRARARRLGLGRFRHSSEEDGEHDRACTAHRSLSSGEMVIRNTCFRRSPSS